MKEEEVNKPNEEIVSTASFIDGDKLPIDDGTGDDNGTDGNTDEGNAGGDSNGQLIDGRPNGNTGSNGPIKDLPDRPINNGGE